VVTNVAGAEAAAAPAKAKRKAPAAKVVNKKKVKVGAR
jgi:hypothetical protein